MLLSPARILSWCLAAAALILIVMYVMWLRGQQHSMEIYRATLISATSSSTLTTSFARVDIFRVLDTQDHWHAVNSFDTVENGAQVDLGKVKAFCSRTLDITFGYADFRAQAREAAGEGTPLPMPRLLTANTVNATDWGKDSAGKCLGRFSGDRDESMIKDALVTDAVWEVHMRNGVDALVAASRRLFKCEPAKGKDAKAAPCPYDVLAAKRDKLFALDTQAFQLATRCGGEEQLQRHSAACAASNALSGEGRALAMQSADEDVASVLRTGERLVAGTGQLPLSAFGFTNGDGYEGTLVLTLSAMAIVGSERRVRLLWIIPLWTKEAFYFRREIAQVTFGSHIGNHALKRARIPWVGPSLALQVAEPAVLSIDRRIAAQGRSGDLHELEKGGRSLATEANEGILEALRAAVQSYDSAARAMSRAIIRERYETDDLDLQFISERTDPYARVFPTS
jgi:hypothetical protein